MTIPGRELVGKNAQLIDRVYTDDYLHALNQFATVDEVFGQLKESIAAGEHTPVAKLVMGTLGKCEWENHLVSLVMGAAKAGEWKAVVREPFKHTDGLTVVEERNFGYVVKQGGERFLMPSASYVTYCKERLAQRQ